MIALDANVVSELVRPRPDARVLAWVDMQVALAIPAIALGEVLAGVARMPAGRKRTGLRDQLAEIAHQYFGGKVLSYDESAAEAYADIMAIRFAAGRPIGLADAQIAATCLIHDATIATRNVRDFEGTGVSLVDPWAAALP